MAIPVDYFQPETFEQANPFLQGFGAVQGLVGQNIQNRQLSAALQAQNLQNQITGVQAQYAAPEAQQDLLKAQLSNQILQPQAQYAPQMTQAALALARTMPGYYGAMASEAGSRAAYNRANTNLLQQQTPFLVDKAQADVFSDPMLSRANQFAMAQRFSGMNPYLAQSLQTLGLGGGGGAQMQGGTGMPLGTQMQGGAPMQAIPYASGLGGAQPNAMNAPNVMSGNPMQNYLMFGSPLSPYFQMQLAAMQKGLETQQTTQATAYNDALTQAQSDAVTGNDMVNAVNQFQQNYGQTNEVGVVAGRLPAVSSAAQQADSASNRLVSMITKQLSPKQLTQYELKFAQTLKPNRAMNPQAAQSSVDFWKQKALRMTEQGQFLNAAKNDGLDIYTANTLWNQYNNQRPVYDFDNNSPNAQYQGTWRDFLNPQAISAAQMGQPYVLPPSFNNQTERKNWFRSLNLGDQATYLGSTGGKI